MTRFSPSLTLLVAGVAVCLSSAVAFAEDAPAPAAVSPAAAVAPAASPAPTAPVVVETPDAAQYCRNIANAAADARYARQALAIQSLEKELDDRIAKLETKRAEFEDWMKKRQEFLDKADGAVVAIYSQMRPDAAAQQIAIMDPEAAAAILSKMNARIASSILNEMSATTAALLTSVMSGLPKAAPPVDGVSG